MDTKAMAKSKRAHSQHHSNKKSHPNQTTPKPPSVVGTSSVVKNAKKQSSSEKTHKSRGGLSSLPVNWDRYEEEEHDSGSEESSRDGGTSGRYSDVVKPKSKGADYRHLISEAQTVSQTHLNSDLDCFASLDDFLPGFNQGIGSILSVRGEGILSSTRDDNFIVEDKATTSYEAPFLSLNLHTLAEKLAKVDLSKRLFIEADLLPPDLCAEESNAGNIQESDQIPKTSQSKTTTRISDDVKSRVFSQNDKVSDPNGEVRSTDSNGSSRPVSTSSDLGSKSAYRGKDEVEQFDGAGQNRALEFAFPDNKLPAFEAASAEADLDMLLDSFNETNFLDSSGSKEKSSYSIPVLQDSTMTSSQLSRRERDSSKATSASVNFDDGIDDLLGETTSLMSRNGTLWTQNMKAPSLDDTLDDLLCETSNQINQTGILQPKDVKTLSLDDSIDDLLAETSNLMNRTGTSQAKKVKPYSLENNSSTSSGSEPKSKVLNDFDSWLDTI